MGDAANPGDFEGMLRFPSGAVMQPGQVIVVANNAVEFNYRYGFNPDFEMVSSYPQVPSMIKYVRWSSGTVRLTNSGDEVVLIDESSAKPEL